MLKKIIIVILGFLFVSTSFGFKSIDLNNYKKIKNILEKNKDKINEDKAGMIIEAAQGNECNYFSDSDIYYIKPSCFLYGTEFLSFQDSVDTVWPFIKSFDKIYDLKSNSFVYTSAKPEFYYDYNLDNFIGTGKIDLLLLSILSLSDYYVKVPKAFLAFSQIRDYSFYVSDKSLELRNKNRLHNFNLAMSKLDNYLLEPGKEIYFNRLISYLPGYKKKNPKSRLAFYGGVCGVSTMLFRNAIINPNLYVKQRYNHSQWYVNFYDKYIWGDDAAVYEFIKKLIIKNIGESPIYFKKKQIGKELYFVSIIPKKIDKFSVINKRQTGKLKAFLETKVFDKNGVFQYNQSWVSRYNRKNYEK